MLPSQQPSLCPLDRRCPLKVCWWRSVCVLYPLLCLVALPSMQEAVKARCGSELVADLEFVCGDRGFYRGKVTGRNAARLRGRGIVEQCCLRGCDLQHLEAYCAKPLRSRRHAPPPTAEALFRTFFQKRILAMGAVRTHHGPHGVSDRRPEAQTAGGSAVRTHRGAASERTRLSDWKTSPSEQ